MTAHRQQCHCFIIRPSEDRTDCACYHTRPAGAWHLGLTGAWAGTLHGLAVICLCHGTVRCTLLTGSVFQDPTSMSAWNFVCPTCEQTKVPAPFPNRGPPSLSWVPKLHSRDLPELDMGGPCQFPLLVSRPAGLRQGPVHLLRQERSRVGVRGDWVHGDRWPGAGSGPLQAACGLRPRHLS